MDETENPLLAAELEWQQRAGDADPYDILRSLGSNGHGTSVMDMRPGGAGRGSAYFSGDNHEQRAAVYAAFLNDIHADCQHDSIDGVGYGLERCMACFVLMANPTATPTGDDRNEVAHKARGTGKPTNMPGGE